MRSMLGLQEIAPYFKGAREVLWLFLVPVGGGIPGGVLLAQKRGLTWPVMMILYFISSNMFYITIYPSNIICNYFI